MKWIFKSKWRVALSIWLGLVCLMCVGFGVLSLMSENRVDSAKILIDSELTQQKCLTTCAKIHENNPNLRIECAKGCESMVYDTYTYKVAIEYNNRFFRSYKNKAEITILDAKLTDKIELVPLNLDSEMDKDASFGLIMREAKDERFAFISTKEPLELRQNIGEIFYSTKYLNSLLLMSLKYMLLLLMAGLLTIFCYRWSSKYFYAFNCKYPKKTQSALKPLNPKDRAFLALSGMVVFSLFIFQFWLGFPGFHVIGDTYGSITLAKDNAHPVFIAYVMQFLYIVFGKHLYYLFLFNLVPFYAGILFLIWGLYVYFRSFWAILPLGIVLVGNIYFQNFIQYHSFALPMMLFCGYSMLFFALLVPLRSNRLRVLLWCGIGIVFFFALLWRHNAIFSVYPASFVIVYMWLRDRGFAQNEFIKRYILGIGAMAALCLSIVIGVPKVLTINQAYPANHPFLHQIAAACVPANDSSCFKDEWYYPHKGFEDIKALYAKYPLSADPFNVPWGFDDERPIPYGKIDGLHSQWIKSILKYPSNFLAHELRFINAMWIQKPGWIFNSQSLQNKASHPWHVSVVNGFPESERSVVLSESREQIYNFLYEHKILFNHLWGVMMSLCVMVVSALVWIFKREWANGLLLFSFSVGFAGFFSAFFIAIFTPVAETRYMSPILPMGIVAVCGFATFILNRYKKEG